MKARLGAALALLCACDPSRPIERERIPSAATTELTSISTHVRGHFERPRPAHRCELGAKRGCFGGDGFVLPAPRNGVATPLYERCVLFPDGVRRWSNADCNTPLVVAFDGSPVVFTRVDGDFAIGEAARSEWVSAKTPWLALDRDGSGCIEDARELFAGFDELASLDANRDGRLDGADPAFAELVLWFDRDQDKRCTPDELAPLASAGIGVLPLGFETRASSGVGSYEGETAPLARGARLVDVHLAALP